MERSIDHHESQRPRTSAGLSRPVILEKMKRRSNNRGTVCLTLLLFTYEAYAEHPRFNGLLLKHERGDWTLEFAPEYDVDTYRSIANPNGPLLDIR
ncbi:hypothetical protein TNIN_226471 [Trichonephila inaurata madagascariensis]|uniref:Uncharacterized protein n=1 Tax=Trichonephila inaurata madagascariensis TaxID=2747483 RepID=A0A8X6XZ79_9ARAC|nr:hypothetical protein TNIN_226471 [Trichonephila inaurata madagascariensis]